jgi:hypothetical protein
MLSAAQIKTQYTLFINKRDILFAWLRSKPGGKFTFI